MSPVHVPRRHSSDSASAYDGVWVVSRVRADSSRFVEDVSKLVPKTGRMPDLIACNVREFVEGDEYERIERCIRLDTYADRPFSGGHGRGVCAHIRVEFINAPIPAHRDFRPRLRSA